MVPLHRQLLSHNESLIMLCLNPSPSASVGGGGKLPLAIYESIYEVDDSATTADGQETGKALKLMFVPMNYTIETGEAEMIGVDFVAKGGFGNAAAEASGLEGPAEASTSAKDGAKKIKLDEEKDTKGKGKEKSDEASAKDGDAPVSAGTQNDECKLYYLMLPIINLWETNNIASARNPHCKSECNPHAPLPNPPSHDISLQSA